MYKTLSLLLFTSCFVLGGCATALLDSTFPKETTHTQAINLQSDQIIALGQAVQNQKEQGLVFIGQDFNYLMTDGSTELLKLLKAIPVEQRSITSPTPLVLTMDDANHFRGVLQIRYNTAMVDLKQTQKDLLKSLGFRENFDLPANQQTATYPYINVFFKGQLYQGQDTQKIQQRLPVAYPITIQQQITTTTKHPIKRVTHTVLYPLAMAFDVITIPPLLIISDLKGDFNK